MSQPAGRSGPVVLLVFFLFLAYGALVGRGADADVLMDAFFKASDCDSRAVAIEDLVSSQLDALEIAGRLRAGRIYSSDVERGWSLHYNQCIDGVARAFHVFIPVDYDPAARYPALVYLHGAVSQLPQPAELIPGRALWESTAAEEGWIVLIPHGDSGATWWSETGRMNIQAQLLFLRRHYNVDENRVFVSGFSDGGTGALWMAFHDATAWAGFIDTYGHPAIAAYGPYQTYPRNLLNRPIRAANGAYDELYPAGEVALYIDQFFDLGVAIEWTTYPTGHDSRAVSLERPSIVAFVESVERDPRADRVVWETSDVIVGRCDWVRIDEIADVGNNLGFKDANVWPLKDEIRFGAAFGYQGAGRGFVVTGVEPWSIAHFAGVKTGDKIVRIAGSPVVSGDEVPTILEAMNPGERIEIEVVRGGETILLDGQVTPIDAVYSRAEPTGSIEAVVTDNRIDVTVRNVARYTLFVSGEQFDLGRPIAVFTNGVEAFSGVVEPDVRFMLEQAARDADRTSVYEAKMEVVVPRME